LDSSVLVIFAWNLELEANFFQLFSKNKFEFGWKSWNGKDSLTVFVFPDRASFSS
jgi:hypothetical protein